MAAVAAPASAAPTVVGGCGGSVSLLKLTTAVKGVGLGDQTTFVKAAGNLAKDQTSKTAIAGNCAGVHRPGDTHVPPPYTHATLTPKSQAAALSGNASCASGATAQAADASAAAAYPLNGKITWTFTQTYTDLITAGTKPFKMQADVAALGFNPAGPDVLDLGGIVLSGINAGAQVSGNIWEDPVAKTGGATGYNTGYELDAAPALGCVDGTPNNANIAQVLSGGGGATATSLLGSSATGLVFSFGE
jgi:hypothetical protein